MDSSISINKKFEQPNELKKSKVSKFTVRLLELNGKKSVDIRAYFNDLPTKKGVRIHPDQAEEIISFLNHLK